MKGGLRQRLVLGFVAVSVTTGLVTAAAMLVGVLILSTIHPIGVNRARGTVFAHLPADPSGAQVFWALTVVGGLTVAVAVLSALAIARRTMRPVGALSEAANRMAQGDLDVRLEPQGEDEIAELARSFNTMATSLSASIRDLQRLEATARRFASDVSHELRSPLAAMTAVTDLLDEQVPAMEPAAGHATRVLLDEVTHLDRLVADLIEMSRFDTRRVSLDLEVVHLGAAVEACLARRGWAGLVAAHVDPALTAVLDRRRIDVILANLVGNAITYGAAPVLIDARLDAGQLVVSVRDHGPGIPADALPLVFDRFFKADPARSRSDSSGLGLAIARENARLHGGDLIAHNPPSGGAKLTLTVPHCATAPPASGELASQ